MRVLFWMNIGFDKQSTSGHLLCAVIDKLVKAGNTVHVVQVDQNGPFPSIPKEIEGPLVTNASIKFSEPAKSNFIKRYFGEIRYCLDCRKELKSHRDYDAVFIQSSNVAGVAVWLTKHYVKKAIVTFNTQDIFPYNAVFSGNVKRGSIVFKALAAVQRYAYKKADHVITISEDMKNLLVEDGVNPDKVEVVYNWSYQDGLYENLDLSPVSCMFHKDYFNVVYAGNIGVMQNVDILIEAAKLMKKDKSTWFHIIGNGVYKERLEARSKKYGIQNISFWPMQPSEMAPLIYSAADINVIPLVKNVYQTALPSKTATCFACQKPVVFAIGAESKFGQKVATETGCPVVSSDKAEELVKVIREIQQGQIQCETRQFFIEHMNSSVNSRAYAEIITRKQP